MFHLFLETAASLTLEWNMTKFKIIFKNLYNNLHLSHGFIGDLSLVRIKYKAYHGSDRRFHLTLSLSCSKCAGIPTLTLSCS